jgi:cytochrome b561
MTNTDNYSARSIFLHWFMAMCIFAVALLGLFLDDLRGEVKVYWVNLHGDIGLIILALWAVRLFWRLHKGVPAPSPALTKFERIASIATHHSLYLLMAVIPVFGLISLMAKGRGLDFGFISVPSLLPKNKNLSELTEDVHSFLAFTLIGLVGVHSAAALWHGWCGDGVLQRMLPQWLTRKRDA